jgi:hypothetical protein
MQSQTFRSKHFAAIAALLVLLSVGLGCNLRSDADWKQELGRKKLSRAKYSGSVSTMTNFYFCPSGEYAKQTQFSGFSTGGAGTLSAANEDVELGSWTVESSTLILKSQDGKTYEFSLSQGADGNVIELDGTGYLVTTHNECER